MTTAASNVFGFANQLAGNSNVFKSAANSTIPMGVLGQLGSIIAASNSKSNKTNSNLSNQAVVSKLETQTRATKELSGSIDNLINISNNTERHLKEIKNILRAISGGGGSGSGGGSGGLGAAAAGAAAGAAGAGAAKKGILSRMLGKTTLGRVLGLGAVAAGAGAAVYAGKQLYDNSGQPNTNTVQEPGWVPADARQPPKLSGESSGPAGATGSPYYGTDASKKAATGQNYGSAPVTGKVNKEEHSELGSLSARYESGGKGVGFISSGKGDPGGQSYGRHQLSTKDSMGAFLRSDEGKPYAAQFKGLSPGTPQFNDVYKKIAAEKGADFEKAQKDFYTRTHYQPLLKHAEKLGYDVNNRGVQESLFSMSVQHGKAKDVVSSAAASGISKNPEEQINSLYSARKSYVKELPTLPDKTKESVLNRYEREQKDAIQYSRGPNSDKLEQDAQRAIKQSKGGSDAVPSEIIEKAREVAKNGPQAVDAFMRAQGHPKNSAWCGDFAAAAVKAAGGTPPKNPQIASNWRNFGEEVSNPQPGDVAVRKAEFSRNRRGDGRTGNPGSHVTLVDSVDPKKAGSFNSLGGNQGKFFKPMPTSQYQFFRSKPKEDNAGSIKIPGTETTPIPPNPKAGIKGLDIAPENRDAIPQTAPSATTPTPDVSVVPPAPADPRIQSINKDAVQEKAAPPSTPEQSQAPQQSAPDPNITKSSDSGEKKDGFFSQDKSSNDWAPNVMNYWKQGKEGINV